MRVVPWLLEYVLMYLSKNTTDGMPLVWKMMDFEARPLVFFTHRGRHTAADLGDWENMGKRETRLTRLQGCKAGSVKGDGITALNQQE